MKTLDTDELLKKEEDKRRNKNAKRNIIVLSVVAIFAVVYIVFNKQVTEVRLNNFGIETSGIILDIDNRLFADPESGYSGGGSSFKTIRYEFQVDGKKYKGLSINPHRENNGYISIPIRTLIEGDSVKIRYLKSNPKINKLDYSIIYSIDIFEK